MPRPPSDRPIRIADAALQLIAASGLHAVTHRAIDARLDLPAGTTSYYARTRAELITRAVELLVERYNETMVDFPLTRIDTDEEAIQIVVATTTVMESREADQIAHFVLLIDLRHAPELHALINAHSPGQVRIEAMAAQLIRQCGIPDAEEHARGLVAVLVGLTLARLAGGSEVLIEKTVRTYWQGMTSARDRR
ncbi:TetR/AcrR family transcriptional regulator [Serinibacter arcticus]|uniref:TetR/AcrR family transcriptional regulator n=1 Tax=Serinibacter arcticus TaxID=1655435 RepID=UPI0010930ABB|nr:TetR family transcriptional regulator [Serinibacter arcticus]